MEVQENVTRPLIRPVEEELNDLPVADEQADETNGGIKASPKLLLACATGTHY